MPKILEQWIEMSKKDAGWYNIAFELDDNNEIVNIYLDGGKLPTMSNFDNELRKRKIELEKTNI